MSDQTKKTELYDRSDVADDTAADDAARDRSNAEWVSVQEQLKATQEEANHNYDRFMRQVAELENFKRRANREKEEAIRFANEALLKDLVSVIDNLERATLHAKTDTHGESLVEGVAMTLKGLLDTLAKHGVVQVSAIGKTFDPQLHEAMAQIERADQEPNTVLEEHQKGYLLKDRLLRPALVTVAKAPATDGKKTQATQVENGAIDD